MLHCSVPRLNFTIIPEDFNAPLEFFWFLGGGSERFMKSRPPLGFIGDSRLYFDAGEDEHRLWIPLPQIQKGILI